MGKAKKRRLAKLARRNREKKAVEKREYEKTEYLGTVFDSLLEARWAAFFDLCSLEWRYKPEIPEELAYINWQPTFSLQLIYMEVPKKNDWLTMWFFVEVQPCSMEPFPEKIASQIMYAHPYNHELIKINSIENIESDIFPPGNREIYDEAAFSIFIVGNLEAIKPIAYEISLNY